MPLHIRTLEPESTAGRSASHAPARRFESESRAARHAFALLERFARHDRVPILIEGESGTGKTYLARHAHRLSPRARAPFQALDVASVDDGLAASELFGHVAGAFTDARQHRQGLFASAHTGTLFLDEIGKASSTVQRRLLVAVESGEIRPVGADRSARVDVRIVAATNVPLARLADDGIFLPDLLARVSCFRVVLPPLRERREDIPGIVAQMLAHRAPQFGYPEPPAVHRELAAALAAAEWPYNLRELDAAIQALLIHGEGASMLTLGHCEADLAYLCDVRTRVRLPAGAATTMSVAEAVREAGSKQAAARLLGVSRSTIHRRLAMDAAAATIA